jgi:hypothetical protein
MQSILAYRGDGIISAAKFNFSNKKNKHQYGLTKHIYPAVLNTYPLAAILNDITSIKR